MKQALQAPLAFVAAWTINDLEEWFTMAPWSRKNARHLQRLPFPLPWSSGGMPARQAHLSISLVGAAVGAAAIAGVRSQGSSSYYRSSVLAFGLHGIVHLGQAASLRGYTPGAFTAATVVLPFWAWTECRRRRTSDRPYSLGERVGAAAIIGALIPTVALAGRITEAANQVS